jgi:hypothetical protein
MCVWKMDFLDNPNTYEALDKLVRFVFSVRSDLLLHKKENYLHNCTKIDFAQGSICSTLNTISVVT